MARKEPRTAPVTEANPFTPHAHGTKDSECLPSSESPIAKGIPIAKAKGAMSAAEAAKAPEMTEYMKLYLY